MKSDAVRGEEVVVALAREGYTTNRRSGDNPMGISVRHASLTRDALVCHIHVNKATDEVTGLYFNCVTDIDYAAQTAALAGTALETCYHAKKRGEVDRYVTSTLKQPVSLETVLALVGKAHERHPWRGHA